PGRRILLAAVHPRRLLRPCRAGQCARAPLRRTQRGLCARGGANDPPPAMAAPTVDLAKTPSFRLDGKRALVPGGGRGSGLAAASALAQAGAHVTLVARTRGEIEPAAQAIIARGDKADALQLDVTDLDAVRRAITAAQPFDVLVNNAGTNRPAA